MSIDQSKALADFVFQSKYARYNSQLGRKETFEEAVDRILQMHLTHLQDNYIHALENAEFNSDFIEAFDFYRRGVIFGSQRGLQFGGEPILRKHCRLFNCAFTYADRLDIFKEVEWVLLCGCGVGVSVEKQYINKLPRMVNRLSTNKEEWIIPDDIEGWSQAIDRLIRYYFEEGSSYPKFDYSSIRPNGALISGGFVAPGPDGLKASIDKIQVILDRVFNTTKQLSPLNVTDILAHCADSVLSGGVRRSAMIILFNPDDEEMFTAKTGNWFYENPQRARFNASTVLERGETDFKIFEKTFEATKEYGEPGFLWRSDKGLGCNPCQPAWAPVITPNGLSTIGDIQIGDKIWSKSGWTTVVNKWSTGVKEVNEYRTSGGVFYGTENHKIVSKGKKIEAKDCDSIDSLTGENCVKDFKYDPQLIMDGLVIGDGYYHKASNNLVVLCIGEKDYDYHNSEVSSLILKHRPGIGETSWEIKTNITYQELLKKPEIVIPDRYMKLSKQEICSFLRGLYSANGSVIRDRVTYKTASPKLRDQIQLLLSYLGIDSYYTTNKPTKVKFSNGEYECKESYDINISSDRYKFKDLIGFIQSYKTDKLNSLNTSKSTNKRYNRKLLSVTKISEEEVFDITVDNDSHTYWTGGVNVSNCGEIGFKPVLNGETGWQFCNLVSISGIAISDEEDFYAACKAAATLATVQASYQKFPFLGKVTENLIKNDPLIGVSISGIMKNPEILLNERILKEGAEVIKSQNSKIARLLGINESSRTCTIKPDGNLSTMTGNSPGCHGEHARRYIRRVQVNKEEEAGKVYQKFNPKSVVESVWSNNHTDNCIMFAIENDSNEVFKSELLGTEQLHVVRTLYENWILAGSRDKSSPIQNNVSNTVTVPADEWDNVKHYIWQNQDYIAGVSFIQASGDLDFTQPPYTEVLTPEELVEEYGEGVIFASGLIVDAEKVFGNLWVACDTFNRKGEQLYATDDDAKEFIKSINVSNDPELLDKPHKEWVKASAKQYDNWAKVLTTLGYTDEFIDELVDADITIPSSEVKKYLNKTAFTHISNLQAKRDVMRRMKKFGNTYFGGNYDEMIKALKSVQLYHDWCDITKNYTPIDWSKVKWKNVLIEANTTGAQACSGGQCEITKL